LRARRQERRRATECRECPIECPMSTGIARQATPIASTRPLPADRSAGAVSKSWALDSEPAFTREQKRRRGEARLRAAPRPMRNPILRRVQAKNSRFPPWRCTSTRT
jgi:hypothetical protein